MTRDTVFKWVRATLDRNPPWLKGGLFVLLLIASPLLLLLFVIEFPFVLKCAQTEEPMDAVPPGIIGVCLRGLSYVAAFFVLPFVLLVGMFQMIFGTAAEDDPNEII